MTFTATASIPEDEPAEAVIVNDGWFPDIEPAAARGLIRIDGTITSERLRDALVTAIATVNDELAKWQALQQAAGYLNLAAVPSPLLDGIKRNLHHYQRAVFCLAKANLIERYRDFDSSGEGNKRADELEPTTGDLYRDYRWVISDMLGIPRSTIDLL